MFHTPTRLVPEASEELRTLGELQDGVVRRDQLKDIGVTSSLLDGMLGARRWQETGPLVIVLHNGPLTYRQQLWVAVLNAGVPAALAARTAAAEQGLVGWKPRAVEILVPRGAVVPRSLGFAMKVHESRRFTADDLHPALAPPQVRIERALIDAATWSRTPRAACGVVAAGVQQKLTTPQRLIEELDAAGAIRFRRLLASALADIRGGAQAVSELDFLRFCRRHGLPTPKLQSVRHDRDGRRRYLDATLTRTDGSELHVEVDGALHLVVNTYWSDMERGNELVIGNERVLRFPSYVIYSNDTRAVSQLRRALNLSEPGSAIAG